MIWEVPFDQHIHWVFNGEEFLLALRMWTSGWDLVVPERNVVFHYYGDSEPRKNPFQGKFIQESAGNERVRYITGISDTFPVDAAAELDHLGLGTVRTRQEYEQFSGLNMRAHTQDDFPCTKVYDWNTKQWLAPGSKRQLPYARPLPRIIGAKPDNKQ